MARPVVAYIAEDELQRSVKLYLNFCLVLINRHMEHLQSEKH